MKAERGMASSLIKELMHRKGISTREMAERLGVTTQAVYSQISGDLRFSSFLKMLEVLGYRMDIRPDNGMGMVNIMEETKCDDCLYKKLSDNIAELIREKEGEE